jgi:hypothetical protein
MLYLAECLFVLLCGSALVYIALVLTAYVLPTEKYERFRKIML